MFLSICLSIYLSIYLSLPFQAAPAPGVRPAGATHCMYLYVYVYVYIYI